MHGMLRSDHRKDSLQANPAYPLYRAAVGIKTHFFVNFNVADKAYFCTAQSIVQVTHSHNPFSLRRIPFNYSFMSNK